MENDVRPLTSEWQMSQGEWFSGTFLVWAAALFLTCTVTIADPDLWGHTLYGIRAIEQGVLVERTDPFCYTEPDAIWVNHEWFSEYSFGWLWSHWGNIGLWLWRNFWILVVFIPAWIALRTFQASLGAAVLLLVYTAFCLSQFVVFVRPQMVTFGCFAVTLLILKRFLEDTESKAIWYLPVIMLVWTNSHGGFLAGVGMQGVVLLWMAWGVLQNEYRCQDLYRLALATGCAWAVTLVNPYGLYLHQMLWDHLVTKQIVREWQPLWEAQQALLYYIPFLLIGLAFFGSRKWAWIDLMLIVVVAYQAVSHIRHVALLAIAVIILLPRPITDAIRNLFPHLHQRWSGNQRRLWRTALIGGTLLAVGGLSVHTIVKLWQQSVPPWQIGVETESKAPGMPVGTIMVMDQEHLHGNILTDYGWAQYVIWQTFPESRIAFDGRYRTIYSAELEQEFVDFQKLNASSAGPTPLLDAYPTEILLLPVASEVRGYLLKRKEWVLIYEDAQAMLWVKQLPRFEKIITRARRNQIPQPQVPLWCLFPADPGAITQEEAVQSSSASGE